MADIREMGITSCKAGRGGRRRLVREGSQPAQRALGDHRNNKHRTHKAEYAYEDRLRGCGINIIGQSGGSKAK
jgi:hypothetical protein